MGKVVAKSFAEWRKVAEEGAVYAITLVRIPENGILYITLSTEAIGGGKVQPYIMDLTSNTSR